MPIDDVPTSVRIPRALLERAEALAPKLARNADVRAMAGPRGVSRSTVLRLAVERGISALEDGPKVTPATIQDSLKVQNTGWRGHLPLCRGPGGTMARRMAALSRGRR